MVAAQEDRQAPAAQLVVHRRVDQPVPGDDFRQMAITVVRRQDGIERTVEVALVAHVADDAGEGLDHAGHAQRVGPHVRAANAGADVGRRADDAG